MTEETGYSGTPGPPDPGRRLIAVLAGVLLVGDVVAALLLGPRLVAWADLDGALLSALRWPSGSTTVPETRPAPPIDDPLTQAAPGRPLSDDAVVNAEVQALLDARAIALLARDRAGFLAALDPASPQFIEQQSAVFDALADVPLGAWTYQVAGDAPTLPPDRAPRSVPRRGSSGCCRPTGSPSSILRTYQRSSSSPLSAVATRGASLGTPTARPWVCDLVATCGTSVRSPSCAARAASCSAWAIWRYWNGTPRRPIARSTP